MDRETLLFFKKNTYRTGRHNKINRNNRKPGETWIEKESVKK